MVGTVNVDRGRGVVTSGDVGGGIAGAGVVGGATGAGMVAAGPDLTVVGGDSSSSSGSVVVVAVEDAPDRVEEPDPEDEDPDPEVDPEPDEATDGTGDSDFPERSGILSGGVASGGLALAMYRLNICAGREPPLTRLTPCTSWSGFAGPSGWPIHTAVVSWRV